jgi:hypothetical protein
MTKTRAAGRYNACGQISHTPHGHVAFPHHEQAQWPACSHPTSNAADDPQFLEMGEFLLIG